MDWIFAELTFDPWIPINEDQILGQCSICNLEATTPAIMNICIKCCRPVHMQCLEQKGYSYFEYLTKLNLWKIGLICCSNEREIKHLDQIFQITKVDGRHKFIAPQYIEHQKDSKSLPTDTTITTNELSYVPFKEVDQKKHEKFEECLFCPTSTDLSLGMVNPSLLQDSKIKQVIKEPLGDLKAHEACMRLFTDSKVTNSIGHSNDQVFECSICFDTDGVCFKCSVQRCDNFMHASCAQLRSVYCPKSNRELFCKFHALTQNRGKLLEDSSYYYFKLEKYKPSVKNPVPKRKCAQTLK